MNKIDLGGIATKTEKKTQHQTLDVHPETKLLLEQWVPINAQFKQLKNQCETLSRQIAFGAKHTFFTAFAGVAMASTVLAATSRGTVKLIFKNAYSKKLTEWALLEAAIGKEKAATHFRYSTALEFAIDSLPEDQQEPCANALIELATEHGWLGAVKATQYIKPRIGFHDARTTLLSPEENEKLDQVLPITAFPML